MKKIERKLAHIDVCLKSNIEYNKRTGLENVEIINQAACPISLSEVNLCTTFLGKKLNVPLMIAPMTYGTNKSDELNILFASAAEHFNIMLGIGSQRIVLENSLSVNNLKIRKYAPNALIFSNLGVGQISHKIDLDMINRAIDMIKADGLMIHFNAIQEACQTKGDVDYRMLFKNLAYLCNYYSRHNFPIFAREICFGFSTDAARRLIDLGISGLDCAGAGGTSWAKVEALCAKTERQRNLALKFAEWGIPTAQSILNVRHISKTIPLIATGGIRTGQDILKSLKLGADIAAMARPMLLKAVCGQDALYEFIEDLINELRIALFASGQITIN